MSEQDAATSLRAENRRLRQLVGEALDLAAEGWSYASDHFRAKWRCEEREAEIRQKAGPYSGEPLCTDCEVSTECPTHFKDPGTYPSPEKGHGRDEDA